MTVKWFVLMFRMLMYRCLVLVPKPLLPCPGEDDHLLIPVCRALSSLNVHFLDISMQVM